jgi:hypothetical protein
MIVIQATVANRHSLPVAIHIIRNSHVIHRESALNPNYQRSLSLHVGDRIIAFDERLDSFPGATPINEHVAKTEGVLLLDIIVASSAHSAFTIPQRRCYDLSTQCHTWSYSRGKKTGGQCHVHLPWWSVCVLRAESILLYGTISRYATMHQRPLFPCMYWNHYFYPSSFHTILCQRENAFWSISS